MLGDGAGRLEFDDAVPVESDFHQDLVGLLGESGRGPGVRGGDIELDRIGDQLEFARADDCSLARICASSAACSVSCTGAHGPASVANRSLHSASVRVAMALVESSTASDVLAAMLSTGVAKRGSSANAWQVDVAARVRPELVGLHHHEARCQRSSEVAYRDPPVD